MNVITVSREYGAGGGEVGRRLAELLGWELLDRELLHQAGQVEHMSDAELESLDEKALSMTDRFRLHPPHERYLHGLTEVARKAAARGQVVLVGRGTRQLLRDAPNALHLRLVAPRAWRAQRMAQREQWSPEQALARCAEVDRTRQRFNYYFFGKTALQPTHYDLVVNSGWVALEDVVALVAAFVRGASTPGGKEHPTVPRVLTLARELGAAEDDWSQRLADRLGFRLVDRELLEQDAVRLGVPLADLEKIDEHPAGIWQRLRSGSLSHRYVEVLGQLMNEWANQGNVLLIGRGSNQLLRTHPRAVHVRLVAPLDVRVRWVMVHHWWREELARQRIAQSDAQRRRFHESYFGADWSNPLEYHLTFNSGRFGPKVVDWIVAAVERLGKSD